MADDELTLSELSAALDNSDVTEEYKTYVLRSLWTQREVPEISNSSQYDAYARWQADLHARLKEAGVVPSDPQYANVKTGRSRPR